MKSNNTTLENKTYHKNSILRIAIAALCVALQVVALILFVVYLGKIATWIEIAIELLSIFLVVRIYAQDKTAAMKMPWIIMILMMPIFGVSLYYLVGGNKGVRWMRKRYKKTDSQFMAMRNSDSGILEEIKTEDRDEYGIARYISEYSGYPVYKNTDIRYFGDTTEALENMLADISKAEHFVFMEYFAIENNTLWERVLEVLEDRVRAGVEVRVLYDDIGSIGYVGKDFRNLMEQKGIKCRIFNQVRAIFNMFMNNRDHRKITVVDGKVGYTGGYNMTREYFNITHPFGIWKDAGVRIEGKAVNSITAAFLEMWNAPILDERLRDKDIVSFFNGENIEDVPSDAFVQPYGDNPMEKTRIGEDVYLSMLAKAEDYCYFMTPYLIITEEMIRSMTLAAERGVDVRIIVPGIPDKKMIYKLTRSFYNSLVTGGVRIFEWTPGFVHSKLCLTDGKMATCGSINLDYRSLYHHFEFGCFFNDRNAVKSLEDDFNRTFSECREVTEQYKKLNYRKSLLQILLRLFAELL